jgi:hypothetical protein
MKTDYEQAIYNINERANKQKNKDAYNFNGEITERNVEVYNYEKNRKIQLTKNNNPRFNVDLWDISFSSSYGFPDNNIGFYGQWMQNKMAPLANHLSSIDLNENVHICFRPIDETDEKTLDYLCNNIVFRNKLKYAGRKSSGDDEDAEETYNRHVKNKTDGGIHFETYNYKYYCIEKNPIQFVCPYYNEFYLDSKDARNKSNKCIEISNYEDIEESLKDIYDSSSHLYAYDELNFCELNEKWLMLIDKIKHFFDTVGHDRPFWTAFLPENIDAFEEVRVLNDCGNFLNVVARSKNYFYFMQFSQ